MTIYSIKMDTISDGITSDNAINEARIVEAFKFFGNIKSIYINHTIFFRKYIIINFEINPITDTVDGNNTFETITREKMFKHLNDGGDITLTLPSRLSNEIIIEQKKNHDYNFKLGNSVIWKVIRWKFTKYTSSVLEPCRKLVAKSNDGTTIELM